MIRSKWLLVFALGLAGQVAVGSDALLARLTAGTNLVHDYAAVFSAPQRAGLELFLRATERATSAEIAVVTVTSLEGSEIDDFANRLFNQWGIGKKGKDNGLLLLAAIEDRKIKIEVGYGLEGTLPDARTGRILDEHVIPRFKEKQYAAGLLAGSTALAGIVAQASGAVVDVPPAMREFAVAAPPPADAAAAGQKEKATSAGGGLGVLAFIGGLITLLIVGKKKGWIRPSASDSGGSGHSSGSGGGSSSGGGGFGGGRSGGGGASRGW